MPFLVFEHMTKAVIYLVYIHSNLHGHLASDVALQWCVYQVLLVLMVVLEKGSDYAVVTYAMIFTHKRG